MFDPSARRGRNGSTHAGRDPAARQIVALERKLREKEDKLRRKDEVLAELMEEHVALTKTLAGPNSSPFGIAIKAINPTRRSGEPGL